MKKTIYQISFLFLLCLLMGCQPSIAQTVGETQEIPTNTAVASPTRFVTETHPILSATITPVSSPSPEPSVTPEPSEVQKDCYSLLPDFPQDANLEGTLILGYQFRYNFLDWEAGNTTEIPPQKAYSEMKVSPDLNKFAFHDTKSNEIVVMTADNEILRRIPWDTSWITLSRWQNNETLLILTKELLKSDAPSPPNVLLIIDTETGQSRKIIPDYPHIAQGFTLPWLSGHTVYDPTLTRVVYAMKKTIDTENYGLWDISGKRELIALEADFREEPVWSPDGATFIVYTKNGLSLVSRDGIVLHTIDLKNTLYIDYTYKPIKDFSYSPDGSRVAFLARVNRSMGKTGYYHLMILDTNSGKITDTCFEDDDDRSGFGWDRPRLVWSPNGEQVAAPINYRAGDQTWDVVIADVEQKYAVKIAERLFPIGWLVDRKAEAREEMKRGEERAQIIIDAIEKYKVDTGKYPSTLDELVPGYLKEILQTETDQIYYYQLSELGYFELWFSIAKEKHANCAYTSRINFEGWECGYTAE